MTIEDYQEKVNPKYVFKENQSLLCISDDDMKSLFSDLMKMSNIDERDILSLYVFNDTKQKRAIMCEWLLRRYKQNKEKKFSFCDLLNVTHAIDEWLSIKDSNK